MSPLQLAICPIAIGGCAAFYTATLQLCVPNDLLNWSSRTSLLVHDTLKKKKMQLPLLDLQNLFIYVKCHMLQKDENNPVAMQTEIRFLPCRLHFWWIGNDWSCPLLLKFSDVSVSPLRLGRQQGLTIG